MGEIEETAKVTNFEDLKSVESAKEKLTNVTDLEINRVCSLDKGGVAMSATTQRAIALAILLRNERDNDQKERLAMKTTIWSGLIGVFGALSGAAVGALLTFALTR